VSIGNSPEDERPFEDVSDVSDVPEKPRPSIGRALRQARIAAGLTVDDVSSATRVRIAIVHAIESDDFAPCGGDVYARGHIRTLARAVHLDPVTHVGGAGGEARVAEQVGDVGGPTGRVVIDAQHVVTLLEQPTTQPRPQEAGSTGHDDDAFRHEQAFLELRTAGRPAARVR